MDTFTKFKSVGARFKADQRGTVAVIAALSAIPLLLATGAAVDLGRAVNARTALRASLDSAALYAATLSDTSNGTLTSKAQAYMAANYVNNQDALISNFAIVNNGTTVTASGTVTLQTAFMGLVGTNTIAVNSISTVLKQGFNLEVSLVMDNTGSMKNVNPVTGNSSVFDAMAAANLFIQMVPPQNNGITYTKIAVVPYNNSVNMGTAALAQSARGIYLPGTTNPVIGTPLTTLGVPVQNFTFNANMTGQQANQSFGNSAAVNCTNTNNTPCQITLPITNCVTERTGTQAATDASMSIYPVGRAYQPGDNGCTVTPIVPLSTTAAPLTAAINSMVAGNSTAGQVGIAWGWYALSPNVGIWSGSSVPASYSVTIGSPSYVSSTPNTNQVHKVMILMTDGDYNSSMCNGVITGNDPNLGDYSNPYYGSAHGTGYPNEHIKCAPTNSDAYTQSAAMCTAIKASGVELYVVSFQLDNSIARNVNLINGCASDAAHVINADTTSPSAAFATIANQINAMRIQS